MPVKSVPIIARRNNGDESGVALADFDVLKCLNRPRLDVAGDDPPEDNPYGREDSDMSFDSTLDGCPPIPPDPLLPTGELDRISSSFSTSITDNFANAFFALRNPPPKRLALLATWSSLSESVPEFSPLLLCAGLRSPIRLGSAAEPERENKHRKKTIRGN